jgi:branched-chain amino acid transport system substrate-binding protein
MRKRSFIFTVLMTVIMIFGLPVISATTTAQAAEPIVLKVGNISPLSGPAGPWGQTPIPAYDAYAELLSKEGINIGGKTYKIQLIHVDDQNSPEGGAAAAKRLIYEEKVKFIVGHWSWNFPSVAAVTNPAKVIFMCRTGNEAVPGGAYNPKKMPYTVFASPSHERFIADVRAIVAAYPNYKKIGINDSTLGKGIGWDYVDRVLTSEGIRFHHEWYPPGTQDFTPYITRYKEAGCDVIYGAGDVMAAMMILKQRWEMGYKDWKIGTAGALLDPMMYIGVSGMDASQGFMSQYSAPWNFKKTKVNPKYIKMCQDVMKIVDQKIGKPYNYTGWIDWVPTHLTILIQALEKAGTVDDTDKIMKVIRGGTFDTPSGKYTMSGAKTYGSPVVFGVAGAMSQIKGDKEVYFSESPWKPLP